MPPALGVAENESRIQLVPSEFPYLLLDNGLHPCPIAKIDAAFASHLNRNSFYRVDLVKSKPVLARDHLTPVDLAACAPCRG